ncbi:MAG: NAD-dependent epimerase/dehydratase family protein [Deltaproteobacteria bacterium]|jgi:UDP-glucose 4-epimerase|nr:NAD-dependent epimerase/dehydratase family protein [Deltaproteobacteria bacterium]MBW2530702.1 NAD-dependent epimerase/dehydratase family protein [Deltaproteobacteria bacterium]
MTGKGAFVVGGAGFIGSHLVDQLVRRGPVTVYDDLSVGRRRFIAEHLDAGRANLIEADALDLDALCAALPGHDLVVHLAANPEARWGLERTRLDLDQGTIATYQVLEAMRRSDVRRLVFASSGTVYGETPRTCAEEDLGALPISLYGASKLAGEALVSAFVECFGLQGWIFRFGNVVGPRGTHGAALDFLHKLRRAGRAAERGSPVELEVLGDGTQQKPYLHVEDCVGGMLFGLRHGTEPLNVFNLAPPDQTSVKRIAELCIAASPTPDATIRYTGGDRGWPGDVPRSMMSPERMAALGWRVRHTSDEAVALAVAALAVEVFGDGAGAEANR